MYEVGLAVLLGIGVGIGLSVTTALIALARK